MEDPPDVINDKKRYETPELSFDELMFSKLQRKFILILNEKRKIGYNEFEKFIEDLNTDCFSTTKCFELYDSIRATSYLFSTRTIDEFKKNVIFRESFIKYMNAKKSKIIDDLIERYV